MTNDREIRHVQIRWVVATDDDEPLFLNMRLLGTPQEFDALLADLHASGLAEAESFPDDPLTVGEFRQQRHHFFEPRAEREAREQERQAEEDARTAELLRAQEEAREQARQKYLVEDRKRKQLVGGPSGGDPGPAAGLG